MESENPTEKNIAPNSKRESDIQADNAKPNVSDSLGVPCSPPTKHHCEITCKTEKHWWDTFKPYVEILGVLLLAVYTGYTIRMYSANRDAANAAASAATSAGSQTQAMIQQLNLQREVTRLDKGGAKVRVYEIAIYHDAGGQSFEHGVRVYNDGKREARDIKVCSELTFHEPPLRRECNTFERVDRTNLQPFNGNPKEIYSSQTAAHNFPWQLLSHDGGTMYTWGVIGYTDYTGALLYQGFCKEVPAKRILDFPVGQGYVKLSDCPIASGESYFPQ